MQTVLTVAQLQALDAAAPVPVETLIDRAGAAVARHGLEMLGGGYGRRVVVVAGTGNNGADGLVAAERLRRRGVGVRVVGLGDVDAIHDVDLVIDAALGTGLSRPFDAPEVGGIPVLAVDIPSGIHGDSGEALGRPVRATRTVTFVAPSPGLLLGAGPEHAGDVHVVDIGLDPGLAPAAPEGSIAQFEDVDVTRSLPARRTDAHKWRHAVLVIAGSAGMTGAASLAAEAAQRAGAGMVRLVVPGVTEPSGAPREAVTLEVDANAWADDVVERSSRDHAVAIGPGLGTSMVARHQIRRVITTLDTAMVIDGDGITALGRDAPELLAGRTAPTVLTPHDGEFERVAGHRPGAGTARLRAVRDLATATRAVVLSKGPTTVVAAPDGSVLLVRSGDERLATAGTGDVLTGIIAAFLAAGVEPLLAAAAGAHVHGLAGRRGPTVGTVAGDVAAAIPAVLSQLRAGVGEGR